MKFEYEVEPATGWGCVTISGEVGVDEVCRLLGAAWSDPRYSGVERALWNFLDAYTAMRLDDLERLTQWIMQNKHGRGARVIAIVAEDDLIFGVGRMFDAIQSEFGWKVGIFRTEAAARAWLGEGTS